MGKKIILTGLLILLLSVLTFPLGCGSNPSSTSTTSTITSTFTSTSSSLTTSPSNKTVTTTIKSTEEMLFPEISRITVQELKTLKDKNTEIIVIDTRDMASYAAGHIPGAIDIPYDITEDPEDFKMRLWILPTDKLMVVY